MRINIQVELNISTCMTLLAKLTSTENIAEQPDMVIEAMRIALQEDSK